MNDIIVKSNATTKTPIEIALGVDENNMTTAKKLYEFLELNSKNYSHWCKRNITENEFAEENVDYWAFVLNDEWGGQATTDYKLTAHFAKKLSCKGNGERAEQAREYFSTLDDKVKEIAINRSQLSPQMQMFYALADNQAQIELEQKRLAEKQDKLEQKVQQQSETIQTVKETFSKTETEQDTTQWVTKCLNKIAESPNFKSEYGNRYSAVKNESYIRLSNKAGCRLDQKLRNAIDRAQSRGYTKQQINKINKLSVIMSDKRLKEIYISIVKEMTIFYCIDTSNAHQPFKSNKGGVQ